METYAGPRLARHRPPILGYDGPLTPRMRPAVTLCQAEKAEKAPSAREDARREVALKALRLMRDRLSDPDLTLSMVAESLYSSERHLQRIFTEFKLGGWRRQLLKLRMERAKELLESDPSKSISQISEEVGYRHPMHFAKAFRRFEGLGPKEYRQGLSAASATDAAAGEPASDEAASDELAAA